MSDDDRGSEDRTDVDALAHVTDYKVLGRTGDRNTVGVLGRNDASTGTPVGVSGEVPNSSGGYGLSTPDDARVLGSLDANSGHTLTIDGTPTLELEAPGTDSDGTDAGGNVVGGYSFNDARDTVGSTIGGGGAGLEYNLVSDNFGTVGGGRGNRAGDGTAATSNATYATVGGGRSNDATNTNATIGGGVGNIASALSSTVGGGDGNAANGDYATVAGGSSNGAGGLRSTVAGGFDNYAGGHDSVVGGGWTNTADGDSSTVAGGEENTAVSGHATVAGGAFNAASGYRTSVGGGFQNAAGGRYARVGGGSTNKAFGTHSIVAGGQENRTGTSDTDKGFAATVPGGSRNVAREDYSFATGHRAKAHHKGSFVWADSRDQEFTSNGTDQFVIEADGGVGIGTNTPFAKLEVANDAFGDAFDDPSKHVAIIDDTADSGSANALAIKAGTEDANGDLPTSVNFVSFYDKDGSSYGAIQGNGTGGTELKSTGSDYAEYLPKRDPDREFEAGDVVGVEGGELVAGAAGANRAMVVSWSHVVLGNDPGRSDEGHEPVAFTGQVPVRVRGPVSDGDLLVPSGQADGTAEAVDPDDWRPGDGPLVGQAWESDPSAGISEVTVAVGIDDPAVLAVDRERIADLEAENRTLRERLADLEARVAAVESPGTAPADD